MTGLGCLLVVGAGAMGEALAGGLLSAGVLAPGDLALIEPAEQRREQLGSKVPGVPVYPDVAGALEGLAGRQPEGAVVAVKPADAEAACRSLAGAGVRRVLSVVAGVRTSDLERWLEPSVAVVRAMPNTPALVGAGAAAIAAGSRAGADDLDWAGAVLGAVGAVVGVEEKALDAVTGLSGSGPAYVFLVAEALTDAGVLVGLSRPVAQQLAVQTLLGSARMLVETGEEPAALRARVTSPGGTTAAGLRVLEAAGLRAAFLEAVSAATERSSQLGST